MNILIVKLSAIGDIIHALPVSYALRQKYPDAHITWVVEPTGLEIVQHNPCVDEIVLFQKKAFKTLHGFKENFKPLRQRLHERSYDVSIDLQGLFKSAAVVLAAGAKRRIGCADMREGSGLISHPVRGRHSSGHIVDRNLDAAAALGCDVEHAVFPIENTPEEIQSAAVLLQRYGIDEDSRFVVFAVGTNWPNKCWAPSYFAELADLLEQFGIKVVLAGFGADDEQRAVSVVNNSQRGDIVNLVGMTSLMQTAAIMRRACSVVGGDTGNLHMAAALGRPAVMLMGPTDPARNGPYNQRYNVITAGHECDGCWKRRCRKNIDCLSVIKPETVLEKIMYNL